MTKRIISVATLLAAVIILASCQTLDIEKKPLPEIPPNRVIQLEAGLYQPLTIEADNLTIIGKGRALTIIEGDCVINASNFTAIGINIRGDVTIKGDNNDLSSVTVSGKIRSSGFNNVW